MSFQGFSPLYLRRRSTGSGKRKESIRKIASVNEYQVGMCSLIILFIHRFSHKFPHPLKSSSRLDI